MSSYTLTGVVCLLVLVCGTNGIVLDTVTVKPPAGPITGYETPHSRQFRGVYFAEPPTGDLRWEAPKLKAKFTSPFQAISNGPGCPQNCSLPKGGCPPVTSEDCLLMNIYTPKHATPSSNLPVMMFIHGGQFHDGFAGSLLYDGDLFVNHTEVVLAVIQYRLGALGFLYTGDDISGNYGLLDQKLALEWLHTNVAAFGGNPNLITAFGQSAGAMSIGAHLVSPAFKGLYQHAILESEPFGIPFRDAATWSGFAKDFAKQAGCDSSGNFDACLRKADVNTLVAAQGAARKDLLADLSNVFQSFVPWTPTVGTELLPEVPLQAWASGQAHDIPIIAGTVENEGLIFVDTAFGKPVSSFEYDLLLGLMFGTQVGNEVKALYPDTNTSDARGVMAELATRCLFRCPTRNASLATSLIPQRTQPVYNYVFDHIASFGKQLWGNSSPECWDAVCHAAELPFVFAPNGTARGIVFTPEETVMSDAMQSFWGNFAHTGNPGTVDGVTWSPLINGDNTAERKSLLIQTPANVLQTNAFDFCGFWDDVGYAWALPSK